MTMERSAKARSESVQSHKDLEGMSSLIGNAPGFTSLDVLLLPLGGSDFRPTK
jgi:hypothetical protein